MKIFFTSLFLLVSACCFSQSHCGYCKDSCSDKSARTGQVAIVAHRGFWNTDATSFSENSIASLHQAAINGFWGCELDIHITCNGKIIVNHDSEINGKKISECKYKDFSKNLLPNGEKRPLLDDYLSVASGYPLTKLVIEFKDAENGIVEKTMKLLKRYGMDSPKRTMFISFNQKACMRVAELYPEYTNQYLTGDLSPEEVHKMGINGIDYHYARFKEHPEWVGQAHKLGMSVNVWTVDNKEDMEEMIALGVDAITTNKPLLLRSILSELELKLK
ncbi:MAG: glycerophosphodiester phosphodiesterase [Alistipes sp.]|nr:glycerophosphodiester phosphodiesterase [Candidatus Minthomonas equi]